jgi:hypothetical protein
MRLGHNRGMRNLPSLADATVVQQVPDQYRLIVSVDVFGGQIPFLPVDVITHGPRDAVRGHFPPLPVPGTRGLVAFTRGDERTGRWIGAQAPSLPDASTLGPASGNVDYTAHWSGAWSWHGQDGTSAFSWPDGTTLVVGPVASGAGGPVMPAPTRHVVDPTGARVRSAFTQAQRVPQAPAAFGAVLTLAAGASIAFAPDGSASLTLAPGKALTLAGDLHVSGAVVAGWGGADQVSLQTHTHPTPDGTSGPPTPGS